MRVRVTNEKAERRRFPSIPLAAECTLHIDLPVPVVVAALSGHFESEGFVLKSTQAADDYQLGHWERKDTLSGLLVRKIPQHVACRVEKVSCHNTCVRLRFGLGIKKLLWCCLIESFLTAILFAAAAKWYRTTEFLFVWIAVAPVLLWFLAHLPDHQDFFHRLVTKLHTKAKLRPLTDEPTLASPQLVLLSVIALAGLMAVVFPARGQPFFWLPATLTAAFLAAGVSYLFSRRAALHLGAGFFAFMVSVIIAIYASFPLGLIALFVRNQKAFSSLDAFATLTRMYLFSVLTVLLLGVLFHFALNHINKTIDRIDYLRAHPELLASTDSGEILFFRFFLVITCLLFGGATFVFGIQACITLGSVAAITMERLSPIHWLLKMVNTRNFWMYDQSSWSYGLSILLALYYLPVAFWFLQSQRGNLRSLQQYRALKKTRGKAGKQDRKVMELVAEIAQFGGLRPPSVHIRKSGWVEAHALIPPLPWLDETLVITSGALKKLSPKQLEAVIAHEIGHVWHRHTRNFSWAYLLSRLFGLGDGYLSAFAGDSQKLEQAADSFAIRWLERQKDAHGRQHLAEALKVVEKERMVRWYQASTKESHGLINEGDWLPARLRREHGEYMRLPPMKELSYLWRAALFLNFHAAHALYIYRPFTERLKGIETTKTGYE